MEEGQWRAATIVLRLLGFSLYAVVAGISLWATDKMIQYDIFGAGNPYYIYYFSISFAAGEIGATLCSFPINHIGSWGLNSLLITPAVACIAWSVTFHNLGAPCKHVGIYLDKDRLRTLESLMIILMILGFIGSTIHDSQRERRPACTCDGKRE